VDGESEAAEYEGEKKDEKDNSHVPFPSAGPSGASIDYPQSGFHTSRAVSGLSRRRGGRLGSHRRPRVPRRRAAAR
jgi:hypothetical protein